jgi:hypothetical protein
MSQRRTPHKVKIKECVDQSARTKRTGKYKDYGLMMNEQWKVR